MPVSRSIPEEWRRRSAEGRAEELAALHARISHEADPAEAVRHYANLFRLLLWTEELQVRLIR